ncbi:MAG TPA: YeeE/YedE thiosulfate transporter family protein [Rhodocyclaceae bacterium]|jgi:hypothetical protein
MLLAEYAQPLAGGLLIGLASAILLFFNGRIAGVSGIARGLFTNNKQDFFARLLFLAGLVVGAWLYEGVSGQTPIPREHFPPLLLALAGVLVATGTSLARGCTSGHGVCGLARFSQRSLIAVITFLITAIVTAYTVRHIWGIY